MQTVKCSTCGKQYPPEALVCPDDQTSLIPSTLPLSDSGSTQPSDNAPAAATPPPKQGFGPGSKVSDYIVEAKIGEGGMGEVWRGKHPSIGKRVAIKILSEKMTSSRKAVARFIQEAKAANEIQNRHIVDIFSFGELEDGRPYLIMELLSGKPLADYLKERGPRPIPEIVEIFGPVCRGLQAAHDRGIIHRDLKPDNIFLVMEEGAPNFPKILDFGIAKLTSDDSNQESLTKTGAMMGTVPYMSPEQCEATKTVDHRTDIYALGIILYELLTGRTPFREPGDGMASIISRHLLMAPPSPGTLVEGRVIPEAISAFAMRSISKKTSERPSRALDFFEELKKAAGSANETEDDVKGAKTVFGASAAQSAQLQSGGYPLPKTVPQTGETSGQVVPAPGRSVGFILAPAMLMLLGVVYFGFLSSPENTPTKLPASQPAASLPASAPQMPANFNDEAKATIAAVKPALLVCYDEARLKTTNLAAFVKFRFVVGPKGDVVSATPLGAGISAEADACMVKTFSQLKFPAPRRQVDFEYPLQFAASSAPTSTSAPAIPSIRLIVHTEPVGAMVYLNDKELGETPLKKEIPYGEDPMRIKITKEGFQPITRDYVPSGPFPTEVLKLKPIPKITPKRPDPDDITPGNN